MFTHFLIKPGAPQWLWLLGVIGDFLIFGAIFFGLLQLIPNRLRKPFVALVTFLMGLVFAIEYFVPAGKDGKNFMTDTTQHMTEITTVLYSFAAGLGIWSLVRFHGRNLMRKRPGWVHNLAFFVAFAAFIGVGFWTEYAPKSASAKAVYDSLFQWTIVAPGATMFSIVGFYIVSAAYRAFRIRSAEATLMLVAAFIVMLGQVPIGAAMTNWIPSGEWYSIFRLENMGYWILNQPNTAAQRGITFGVEVGALAMSLRLWLSLERGSFFDQEL